MKTHDPIVDENQLEAVISLPAGVFKPYAGVSTAILVFTKGGRTEDVWFYDDGFSPVAAEGAKGSWKPVNERSAFKVYKSRTLD